MKKYAGALEYSPKLRNDRDFLLTAMEKNADVLLCASDDIKNDRDFMLAAVQEKRERA